MNASPAKRFDVSSVDKKLDDATRSAAPEEKPKRHEGGMSERVTENATGKCDWKHVQGASRNASEWDELHTENC